MCFATLHNITLTLISGMAYIVNNLLYCLPGNGRLSLVFLNVILTFRDVDILLEHSISCKRCDD